ncbi:MAG: TlpA family protein disulfide reductase [Fastidiosipilaceae bacterium]|jgi:thiol-disulfide isomerase/thioredoxin
MKSLLNKLTVLSLTALIAITMLGGCGKAKDVDTGASTASQNESSDTGDDSAKSVVVPEVPAADPAAKKESFAHFNSVDLKGAPFSASTLGDHKLLFINFWGTFCPPCLKEMPDLGELSEEYPESEVQFIGVVVDTVGSNGSYSPDQIKLAKYIVDETGANYSHILPSPDLATIYLDQVDVIPTTLLVDSDGEILSSVIGMRTKSDWKEVIDEALSELN